MGQQQLLLVILVTIIVGIATVVAINTFSGAADSANLDAVRQDVAAIGAAAQGYYMKPTMLGGGGNSFTGITFNTMALGADSIDTSDGLAAINANGVYEIVVANAGAELQVDAYPASRGNTDISSPTGTALEATITQGSITWTANN